MNAAIEDRRKLDPKTLRPLQPDYCDRTTPEYQKLKTWLGDDIIARGQRQDILTFEEDLNPPPGDSGLRILDGQTRTDALIYRGRDAWVKVLTGLTPGEKVNESALANIRREVDWLEKVAYWQEMIVANGWNQAQLAKVVGESTATVSKRLSLHEKATPEELMKLMDKDKAKRLPFRALDALVRHFALPEDRKPWIVKMTAGMTVDVLDAELAKLRTNKKPKEKPVKAQCMGGSVALPGSWTWDSISAFAGRLAEAAKKGAKGELPTSMLTKLMS